MIANALPDGLTTYDRRYLYLEVYGGRLPDGLPADGTLAVNETTGKRVVRHVARRYAVQSLPATGYPGRVYLLVKLSQAGNDDTAAGRAGESRAGEVYECRVGTGLTPRCTCTAGATAHARNPGGRVQSVPCVHLECLADLLLMGLDTPDDAPLPVPPPRPTPEEQALERLHRARLAHDAVQDEIERERLLPLEPCPF